MTRRIILFPALAFIFLFTNLPWAFAAPALSYEQERTSYIKFLQGIVLEAKQSGIVTDVKLSANKDKEQENKIEKLKKDLLKAIQLLEKNKVKLKNHSLQNNKLISTNQKIIASFDQSIKAMQNLHQSIVDYDLIGFIKSFKELKEGDEMLHDALKEIGAEYILKKGKDE